MPAKIHQFPCLSDNFGVLIHDPATGATAAIDAPEAAAVEKALKDTGWTLTDILVTHHHADHTQGIPELKAKHKCRVTAPKNEAAKIADADATYGEGDTVKVGSLEARVIDTPGHTAGHISLVFDKEKIGFFGDTLFSIGCGRVIEGTPAQMWDSLSEDPRAAGRHHLLLRPRIHAGQHQIRAHHRAGQSGLAEARGRSRRIARRRQADAAADARRGEGRELSSCARTFPRSRRRSACRAKPAADVFTEVRARKNKF